MSEQANHPRQSWDESVPFEPWLSQSISEDATVYVGEPGEQERAYRGRVCRDDHWVHVQTARERMSFPREQVHGIRWASVDD